MIIMIDNDDKIAHEIRQIVFILQIMQNKKEKKVS